MEKIQDFTEGKIVTPLLKFAGPVFLALFLQAMYGAVDLLIVGQFATTSDVSAVATGSMLMQCITDFFVSLATGITILLGQKIGEKRIDEAGKIIGSSIALFALIAVIFTSIFVIGSSVFAGILKAPDDAFCQTTDYIRICSGGIVFIIAFNVLGSIFRGIGDSKMPLVTVAIACVANIILDLLFVAVFQWGAAGAAFATILAQALSVFLSIIIIRTNKLGISFSLKDIHFYRRYVSKILSFGIPIAFQDMLVSISFLVIMAIVNTLGLSQSAGVGVAEKVCAFLMLIPFAYMQSLSSFVAQNVGAGKLDRARKSLGCAIGTSFVAAIAMWYMGFFHGDLLASIFTDDSNVIPMAADYIKAYSIDCLLTAELFCFNGFFNGLGKTRFVMIQGILGAFAIRIPVSYIMSKMSWASLFHIGLATPASTLFQITLCTIFFIVITRKSRYVSQA